MSNALDQSLSKLNKQLSKIPNLTKKSLLAGALTLERFAKENAPVITGALRSSGHSEETAEGAQLVFDVNYAFYVEMGSSRNAPNPFVRPAIDAHGRDIIEAITNQANKEIKGGL